MSKNKILIGSFILLSTLISLFPPFSWGDEKLRTMSERKKIYSYLEDYIPLKEYDFLFNDLKKEFVFANKKVVLERHLIVHELLIEIFIAFLVSILFQFLYQRLPYKILVFGVCIIVIILISVLTLFIIDKAAPLFEPSYSHRLQKKNTYSSKYENLFYGRNVGELSGIVSDLRKGFRIEWDNSTNSFWNSIYSSIEIDSNEYPHITHFLEKDVEKQKNKSREIIPQEIVIRFKDKKWSNKSGVGAFEDVQEEAKKLINDNFSIYNGYKPPIGYSINYSKLLKQIDLKKYHILIRFLQDYENYWTKIIPRIKLFSVLGTIILTTVIFFIQRKWLVNKIKMFDAYLSKEPLLQESVR